MKFHHLSKQTQLAIAQQQALNLNHHHQQHHQEQSNIISDEEDDPDFDEIVPASRATLFEHVVEQQVQSQQQSNNGQQQNGNNQQQHHLTNHHHQTLETGAFLMDKNKKLFPQKLWELIHNPSIQHCLRWSQDGQRVYLNRNEFENYYLKTPNNQFHTQKAISFVRQMNMYGFRKVDDCYYENDNFRRGRQHLLKNMIRRHPNKGLFVGLDHHQIAAAAAAQQALQVNQHLQQLEQQHKQRTEQALRLNRYLSSHNQHQLSQHQQQAAAAAAAAAAANLLNQHPHNHHQHHHHSNSLQSTLEQMSSQFASQVAAANSFAAAHQQQQQQNLQLNNDTNNNNNNNEIAVAAAAAAAQLKHLKSAADQQAAPSSSATMQHKKSRLLSSVFNYAAMSNANGVARRAVGPVGVQQQPDDNQDSMHSTSSVETQSSSAVNSGSAGSPQPNSPSAHNLHKRLAKQALSGPGAAAPTDLSSNSAMLNRQALHETLVRSLLQLKQNSQYPSQHDALLASLQQQNPRTLLESLASLSTAGSSSIVDPASSSPTERTDTPPSSPPSPTNDGLDVDEEGPDATPPKYDSLSTFNGTSNNNNMALDLAKSSRKQHESGPTSAKLEADSEYLIDIEQGGDDDTEVEDEAPMDAARKVKRFLNNQMSADSVKATDNVNPIKKRKLDDLENGDDEGATLDRDEDHLSKSLVLQVCQARGDRLDQSALGETANYVKQFLEILLKDAALIKRHSSIDEDELKGEQQNGSLIGDYTKSEEPENDENKVIDASSISLALKLIPSKLLTSIKQQSDTKA